MKETVEEAAMRELTHSYATVIGGKLAYQRNAMLNMFRNGAEWHANQSPWISVEDERKPSYKQNVIVVYQYENKYHIRESWYFGVGKWEYAGCPVLFWMQIPSFDEIIEAKNDVLQRIKEKGD